MPPGLLLPLFWDMAKTNIVLLLIQRLFSGLAVLPRWGFNFSGRQKLLRHLFQCSPNGIRPSISYLRNISYAFLFVKAGFLKIIFIGPSRLVEEQASLSNRLS